MVVKDNARAQAVAARVEAAKEAKGAESAVETAGPDGKEGAEHSKRAVPVKNEEATGATGLVDLIWSFRFVFMYLGECAGRGRTVIRRCLCSPPCS